MATPAAAIGTAVAVIGKVVDAIAKIPDAVAGFVEAFNPGAVEAMDEAFRGLQATVGFALEPIIQAVTEVFRSLAGQVNDAFSELRPIVAEVSGIFLNVLAPVLQYVGTAFRNAADTLRSLMPVIRLVMKAFEGIVNVATTFYTIVNTVFTHVVQAIAESFGGLGGAIDAVETAFVSFTVGLIRLTDAVLRFIGATELADKLLRAFSREPGKGRNAAPKDVSVSNIEDVYRKRLQEAAKGQGGTGLTKTESIMDKIRQEVEQIRKEMQQSKTGGKAEAKQVLEGAAAGAGYGPALRGLREINRWANRQEFKAAREAFRAATGI